MARPRKPDRQCWVRYEVRHLVEEYLSAQHDFDRHRDRLQQSPLGDSPSEMHRKNPGRPRLETCRELLVMAIKAVGPVRLHGQQFNTDRFLINVTSAADDSIQDARGLFVEIMSPIDGRSRKA